MSVHLRSVWASQGGRHMGKARSGDASETEGPLNREGILLDRGHVALTLVTSTLPPKPLTAEVTACTVLGSSPTHSASGDNGGAEGSQARSRSQHGGRGPYLCSPGPTPTPAPRQELGRSTCCVSSPGGRRAGSHLMPVPHSWWDRAREPIVTRPEAGREGSGWAGGPGRRLPGGGRSGSP